MAVNRQRLDRFLGKYFDINRKHVKGLLTSKHISVDYVHALDGDQIIDTFSHITCDGETLQSNTPVYLMLHKPAGVVSATRDAGHKTVLDLVAHPDKHKLHIAGRLDLNSSGLLLLTNDSRWSRALMDPGQKVSKVYRVELANPLTPEYIPAFATGMYFPYEDITTLPAILEIVDDKVALVTLTEGRYHQIKRMFGRFRNPVIALHRIAIGAIQLDAGLGPGEYRHLQAGEISPFSVS